MNRYYVYIMSNSSRSVLYIGVTNELMRRIKEHRSGEMPGFSAKYRCHHLLYYEEYNDINAAITREKQLKGWTRIKKERLITAFNPNLKDISAEWA